MPGLRREVSSLQVMLLEMSEVYPKVSTQDSGNEASEFKGMQVWLTAGHPDVWSRAWTHALHHTPPVPAADRCLKCLITADEDAHVFSCFPSNFQSTTQKVMCLTPCSYKNWNTGEKKMFGMNIYASWPCLLLCCILCLSAVKCASLLLETRGRKPKKYVGCLASHWENLY